MSLVFRFPKTPFFTKLPGTTGPLCLVCLAKKGVYVSKIVRHPVAHWCVSGPCAFAGNQTFAAFRFSADRRLSGSQATVCGSSNLSPVSAARRVHFLTTKRNLARQTSQQNRTEALADFAALPVAFGNGGRPMPASVPRSSGRPLALPHANDAVLSLHSHANTSPDASISIWMTLANANAAATISGTKLLPGHTNYLIGNNPANWHTGLPTSPPCNIKTSTAASTCSITAITKLLSTTRSCPWCQPQSNRVEYRGSFPPLGFRVGRSIAFHGERPNLL